MPSLFKFQKIGSQFLQQNNRCLLADEMGLGKTPQVIDACRKLSPVLIACPAVAKYNWQKEFLKFDNRASHVVEYGIAPMSQVVIASFNYITEHLDYFTKRHWAVVVPDEFHYLKEPSSQRSKAIFGNEGLIHCSDRLWALSGTPAPNHAGELWIILYTFGYTKLSYDGFVARYCNSHHSSGYYSRIQITGSNTKYTPELKLLLKKMSLRRLKKNELDLPPMLHNVFYIKEDKSDLFKHKPGFMEKLHREFETLTDKLDIILDLPTDDKIISALQFLSQSVGALRRYHGLKKIVPTFNIIKEELALGLYKKIVVFGIHTDVLETLHALFRDNNIGSCLITGKVPARERVMWQDRFQEEPSLQVFIGNIQAAGTNLTLTAASQVIFIEQDWVPGNNKQAADRTHRWGQKHTVNVRYIAIKDSIDAKITATVTRKVQEISTFID